MDPLEKWEYMTTMVCANTRNEGVGEFMHKRWPQWTNVPQFAAETMVPQLNKYGDQGWELIHMQPVMLGQNDDVNFDRSGRIFSNWYFCVFKRRVTA